MKTPITISLTLALAGVALAKQPQLFLPPEKTLQITNKERKRTAIPEGCTVVSKEFNVALNKPVIKELSCTTSTGTEKIRPARVHFLGGFGGMGGSTNGKEKSWAFIVAFEQEVSDYISWQLSHFNEGHFQNSHRDGFAMQLFANLPLRVLGLGSLTDRMRLRFGVGPSIYFNTVDLSDEQKQQVENKYGNKYGDYEEEKTGVGMKFSAGFDIQVIGGLILGLGVDEHVAFGSHDALIWGPTIGYELFAAPEVVKPDYAVTVGSGKVVRNAQGGNGTPLAVSLRKNDLLKIKQLSAEAGYLALNDPNGRQGGQIGVNVGEQYGKEGDLELEAGLAAYIYGDSEDNGQDMSGLAALIKMCAKYRLWKDTKAVGCFIREAGSPETQNYDVFMAGVEQGFNFPFNKPKEAVQSEQLQ